MYPADLVQQDFAALEWLKQGRASRFDNVSVQQTQQLRISHWETFSSKDYSLIHKGYLISVLLYTQHSAVGLETFSGIQWRKKDLKEKSYDVISSFAFSFECYKQFMYR